MFICEYWKYHEHIAYIRRMPCKTSKRALRTAMKHLGLTRDAFADRLGVARRALDSWLLPATSREHRRMPGVVAKLLADLPGVPAEAPGAPGELRASFTKRGKPHLLSVAQFDREAVEALLRVAEAMEPIARRRKVTRVLEGAVLAQPLLRAQHPHARELRRRLLPPGRLRLRHDRLHVLVDGEGRVDRRHEPRRERLRRRDRRAPSRAGLGGASSRATRTCR